MNKKIIYICVLLLFLPVTLMAQTPAARIQAAQDTPSTASFPTRLGTHFDAYVVGPEAAASGVLLVPGRWGLDDKVKLWVEYLGLLGYRVVALDLYDGRPVRDLAMMREVRQSIDPVWQSGNLQGALDALAGQQHLVVMTLDVAADQMAEVLGMAGGKVAAVILVAADAGVMVGLPELRLSHVELNQDNKTRVEQFLSRAFLAGELR